MADAEPEALPVVDSEATVVKLIVPLPTAVALMDRLVRTEAQAVLVAEADREPAPTDAEGQREGETVPVGEAAPEREPEFSGELDREGDPVCDTEGCGDSEYVVVADTEEVADAVSEGELVEEGDVVRLTTGESVFGAVALCTAEAEEDTEAEPDRVRGPVLVADALSETRPDTVTGGLREVVVVDEGEKVTTVAEAVAESVVPLEAVGAAEFVGPEDTEALAEADIEGDPDTEDVRLTSAEADTVDVDDTVGDFDCAPVLVGVVEPEGEPVAETDFTAEAVGVEELEVKLENVAAPEVEASEDREAVELAEAAPLTLEVEDGELLAVNVTTEEEEADTELDEVPDLDGDPVPETVAFTVPEAAAEKLIPPEAVAEFEGLPDTVAESTCEMDPLIVDVGVGVIAEEGVAHEESYGEKLVAVVPEGVLDRVAFTLFVCVDIADALASDVALTLPVIEGKLVAEPVAPGVPVYVGVTVADFEGEPEAELDTVDVRTPLGEGLPEFVLLA